MGTASATKQKQITDRDRFWLDHQTAQSASGQTAKEYASAHDLSLHAFYQARKRLRALGVLPPATSERKPKTNEPPARTVSFSKGDVAPNAIEPRFRLELPSGVALEWPGGAVPESVALLLERLARLA
jgi:hypothetical protein